MIDHENNIIHNRCNRRKAFSKNNANLLDSMRMNAILITHHRLRSLAFLQGVLCSKFRLRDDRDRDVNPQNMAGQSVAVSHQLSCHCFNCLFSSPTEYFSFFIAYL